MPPDDGTVYGTVKLLASADVQLEEPEPTAEPTGLSDQQKTAVEIVVAIAAFLLLVFVILLIFRQRRIKNRRRKGKNRTRAKSRTQAKGQNSKRR